MVLISIVAATAGLGLISGVLTVALIEWDTNSTEHRQISRKRGHLSRAQLRGFLVPALFLSIFGMLLLIHGCSTQNTLWLSIGYGSLFLASIFLGGLLYEANF
jgi:hypothetical protein